MMKGQIMKGNHLMREIVETPFGNFVLEASPRGLYRLRFPGAESQKTVSENSGTQYKVLSKARKLLLKYLSGTSVSFSSLAVDLNGLSPFQRQVLQALKKVGWGTCLSYSALAGRAGFPNASRAVGSTMRKNRLPIFLPCHRVVTSQGKLGGYSAGLKWKKRLLTLEGNIPDVS